MIRSRLGAVSIAGVIIAALAAGVAPAPSAAAAAAPAASGKDTNAFGRKHVSARYQKGHRKARSGHAKAKRSHHAKRHRAKGHRGKHHAKRGHHAHKRHSRHYRRHHGKRYRKGHHYDRRHAKRHRKHYRKHHRKHYRKHHRRHRYHKRDHGVSIGFHIGGSPGFYAYSHRYPKRYGGHYGYYGKTHAYGRYGHRYPRYRSYGRGVDVYAPRYEHNETRIYTHRDYLRREAPGYKVVPQDGDDRPRRDSMYDEPGRGSMYDEPGTPRGDRLNGAGLEGVAPLATLPAGWATLARGEPDRSWKVFADRAGERADRAEPKLGYALSAALLNDPERAAWAIRRALRLDDVEYAFLAVRRGARDERLYERLVNIGARYERIDTPDARLVAATAHAALGDRDAARRIAERSLDRDPSGARDDVRRLLDVVESLPEPLYDEPGRSALSR